MPEMAPIPVPAGRGNVPWLVSARGKVDGPPTPSFRLHQPSTTPKQILCRRYQALGSALIENRIVIVFLHTNHRLLPGRAIVLLYPALRQSLPEKFLSGQRLFTRESLLYNGITTLHKLIYLLLREYTESHKNPFLVYLHAYIFV